MNKICDDEAEQSALNSAIHKATGSLVTGRSLQNGKMSMGNRGTERPPDPVLYGGRPSGGFVNRSVKGIQHVSILWTKLILEKCWMKSMKPEPNYT